MSRLFYPVPQPIIRQSDLTSFKSSKIGRPTGQSLYRSVTGGPISSSLLTLSILPYSSPRLDRYRPAKKSPSWKWDRRSRCHQLNINGLDTDDHPPLANHRHAPEHARLMVVSSSISPIDLGSGPRRLTCMQGRRVQRHDIPLPLLPLYRYILPFSLRIFLPIFLVRLSLNHADR